MYCCAINTRLAVLDGFHQLTVSIYRGVSCIKAVSKLPSINIFAAASLHVETRSVSHFCLGNGRSMVRKPVTLWFIVEFLGHSKQMVFQSTLPHDRSLPCTVLHSNPARLHGEIKKGFYFRLVSNKLKAHSDRC